MRSLHRRILTGAFAIAALALGGGAAGFGAGEAASETALGEEATPRPAVGAPFVRVLGTAQDGGMPHAACSCARCERARQDPARRRYVASLAVIVPATAKTYLLDATPDLRPQLDLLADVRDAPAGRVDRAPVDGVLLTHAHLGHYTGLAFFGFEAVHSRDLPVWCTPKMADFLRRHGPWSQLVAIGNVALREVAPGEAVALDAGVGIEFLAVPHRDEYADTVGFVVRGPHRSLLYVPDTDAWVAWPTPLTQVLAGIDVAILDGSFYSMDELPGRDMSAVKHPLITLSMDLLQATVDSGATEVYFTHLNHSNPALEPESAARRVIEARGFAVLAEGQEIPL